MKASSLPQKWHLHSLAVTHSGLPRCTVMASAHPLVLPCLARPLVCLRALRRHVAGHGVLQSSLIRRKYSYRFQATSACRPGFRGNYMCTGEVDSEVLYMELRPVSGQDRGLCAFSRGGFALRRIARRSCCCLLKALRTQPINHCTRTLSACLSLFVY